MSCRSKQRPDSWRPQLPTQQPGSSELTCVLGHRGQGGCGRRCFPVSVSAAARVAAQDGQGFQGLHSVAQEDGGLAQGTTPPCPHQGQAAHIQRAKGPRHKEPGDCGAQRLTAHPACSAPGRPCQAQQRDASCSAKHLRETWSLPKALAVQPREYQGAWQEVAGRGCSQKHGAGEARPAPLASGGRGRRTGKGLQANAPSLSGPSRAQSRSSWRQPYR